MTDQNVECSVKITFVLVNNIIEFELIIIKVIGLSQKSNLLKWNHSSQFFWICNTHCTNHVIDGSYNTDEYTHNFLQIYTDKTELQVHDHR